jgi:hypothetical protein
MRPKRRPSRKVQRLLPQLAGTPGGCCRGLANRQAPTKPNLRRDRVRPGALDSPIAANPTRGRYNRYRGHVSLTAEPRLTVGNHAEATQHEQRQYSQRLRLVRPERCLGRIPDSPPGPDKRPVSLTLAILSLPSYTHRPRCRGPHAGGGFWDNFSIPHFDFVWEILKTYSRPYKGPPRSHVCQICTPHPQNGQLRAKGSLVGLQGAGYPTPGLRTLHRVPYIACPIPEYPTPEYPTSRTLHRVPYI